jgi:hypothetical protein
VHWVLEVQLAGQGHCPWPEQKDGSVRPASVQLVAEQALALDQSSHPPAPLHRPSVPQVEDAVTAQAPVGSVMPVFTLAHVPSGDPVDRKAQAWHDPVHPEPQQTPLTQKLEVHWSLPEQAAPLMPLAVHTPLAPGFLQ